MLRAAISSSACSKTSPRGGAVGGEAEEDAAPRRHRVPRRELAPPGHRAEGERLVPREDHPGAERRRRQPEHVGDLPRRPAGPQPQRLAVLLEEVAAELEVEEPVHRVEGNPEGVGDDPGPHYVREDRTPGGDRKRGKRYGRDPFHRLRGRWIGQDDARRADPGEEMGEVPRVESEEDVRFLPARADRDVHHANGVGVPAAADAAHVVLGGVEVVPGGQGHAGDERPCRVNALPGAARDADVDVGAHSEASNPSDERARGEVAPAAATG